MGLSHSSTAKPTVGPIKTPDTQNSSLTAQIATVAPATTPKAIVVPANTKVVVMTKDQISTAMQVNNQQLLAGVSSTSGPSTYPALSIADLNGPTAPATNPCYANLADGSLTSAMVTAQYPGAIQSKYLLTPQEYQCWSFL